MPIRVFRDDDRSTESDLPADVRDVVRRVPYLRKVFDIPLLVDAEQAFYIDSDCLLLRQPTEWEGQLRYQATPANERESVVGFWREMGWQHRDVPRFCAGIFSFEPSLFIENRHTAIEWVRMMIRLGRDRMLHPGVECEQGLVSGLWLSHYPDNPLPMDAYPYWKAPTATTAIWHAGEAKHEQAGQDFLAAYERSMA
ncbi:MAG: hypothetical protein IMZ62_08045 [Chloroflexi bacterium]|nr:hypothetical protein [Chloroflexota bacterium]MBE3118785.1 hypothetical protein [Candidatus Atribacteria bacterium]